MNIKLFDNYYLTNDERQFIIEKRIGNTKPKGIKYLTTFESALDEAAYLYLMQCQDTVNNLNEYIQLRDKVYNSLNKAKAKIKFKRK